MRRELDENEAERHDVVIHAGYEIFVVGFLLLQLVNSALLFLPLRDEQRDIVLTFWIGISIFLFVDALNRVRRAPNKRRHFASHFGWLTWLGSMPIPFVTSVRLIAVAVVLRKLRRGEFKAIGEVVFSRHAQSTMLLVVFFAVAFFEFGSLMILVAEDGAPHANITTSEDAIWWSVVTISTVGYGDTFPTTYWGRVIGFVLILSGVGLFTSMTSFLAHWFIQPRATKVEPLAVVQKPSGTQVQIREIRSLLADLEDNHRNAVAALEDRLDQLEGSMTADSDR